MKRKQRESLTRAELALDQVVVLQAEIDALTARRTAAIREFEEAFDDVFPVEAFPLQERSRRAELACALRVPERAAERLLGEARVLVGELPATLQQLADGMFSYRHAQTLVDELSGLEPEDRTAIERVALGSAPHQTASRFSRTVRRLREKRRPETMTRRCTDAYADRDVTVEPAADGMAHLTAYLHAVDAEAIRERLTATARQSRASGDPRTAGQLRADTFTDALLDRDSTLGFGPTALDALGATAEGFLQAQEDALGRFRGIAPTVIVTVPALTLLGGTQPGHVEGIGPIDPETARLLTAEAPSLFRLLTHPETGAKLSLGRDSYAVPEGLRKWLRIRDGSCRFPGCGIRTAHCDIDHTLDWAREGVTAHGNLAHLSRGHHTLKHQGGWSVDQPRAGTLVWTSPLRRSYTTEPELGFEPPEIRVAPRVARRE